MLWPVFFFCLLSYQVYKRRETDSRKVFECDGSVSRRFKGATVSGSRVISWQSVQGVEDGIRSGFQPVTSRHCRLCYWYSGEDGQTGLRPLKGMGNSTTDICKIASRYCHSCMHGPRDSQRDDGSHAVYCPPFLFSQSEEAAAKWPTVMDSLSKLQPSTNYPWSD